MSCDHTVGVDVRSDMLIERDHLTGEVERRTLDVVSITCRGCGRPFTVGTDLGFAVRLDAPADIRIEAPPAVTVDDFEAVA